MVLHLLGKKSWNVYNHDNVNRVRKDEAEAKAREEAVEQRMQEEDAARRIAILRGEAVPALPESQPDEQQYEHHRSRNEDYATRDRKRRRRHGEDDTDRDIRYARQDREVGEKAKQTLSIEQIKKGANVEAPLQDHAGHIQLFAPPAEKDVRARQKNEEAEAEKAKKRKRDEDLVTMKFSNAAGYNNGMQKPWYAAGQATKPVETASRNEVMLAELKGKDVWGNEDPSRRNRETKRIVSSDPFAAMQNAQKQLKQSEKDKQEWEKRQKAEIEQLKREQRRQRRDDVDSLDGFSLDAPAIGGGEERSKHRHHHRRHRSRSRDRERRRRHRSRSRDREHGRSHRSRSKEREKHSRHDHRDRHRERVENR